MSTDDALLFVDANIYLDLYRTVSGKKLLAPLSEQAQHVFVTQQVVNEVKRRKIEVVTEFLARQLTTLKMQTYAVPDHLFGSSEEDSKEILKEMKSVHQKIEEINIKIKNLTGRIMSKVALSQDEVSTALAPIFEKAVPHTEQELQRARDRKERGVPLGKAGDPLGDQLTWEQISTHFVGKKKLWIISRDGDFGSAYEGQGWLNQVLHEELNTMSTGIEAFYFKDLCDGIQHFVDKTGAEATKRLTPAEIKEIKQEEENLPPWGWTTGGVDDVAAMEAIKAAHQRQRWGTLLASTASGQVFSP